MSRMIAILFFLFWGMGSSHSHSALPMHEFHISKCQIDYNLEEKALQMTMHIFIDDLEEALRKEGIDKLFLCSDKEKKQADRHLYQYLQKYFLITVNEEAASYEYVGKEPSEDLLGVWVYLEITDVQDIQQLTVKNRVLLDLFDDQKNITSVTVPPGKQNYFILEKGKSEESISYF